MRYVATAAALVGTALATLPATVDPCPAAPTALPPVTVTEQYQTVSLCVPTTTCSDSTCSTAYPLVSPSVFVSTVIPCMVSGTSASSCTITTTDQNVPCSVTSSIMTMVTPMPFSYLEGNMTKVGTSYTTNYATTSMEWDAPYNKIGPLAIPGYGGSGLCEDCDEGSNGDRKQFYSINQCYASQGATPVCHDYPFTYVSTHAPSATSQTSAVCSSQAAVDQPGTYIYTFPQVAPAYTMTTNDETYTVPPQPWYAYATQTATGPTTFDFTVTITKLITYHQPQPQTPPASKQTQWSDWGNWKTSATTTPVKPTMTSASWSVWQAYQTSSSNSGPWTTATITTTTFILTTPTTPASTTSSDLSDASPTANTPQFNIQIATNAQKRFRKRSDTKYIGFGGGDGQTVDQSEAAVFWYDSDNALRSGSSYIETDGSGYITFELTDTRSDSSIQFSGGVGSAISLPGASFCVAGDNVIISFSSSPAGCVPAQLSAVEAGAGTTTTTAATTTSLTVKEDPAVTTTPATNINTTPSATTASADPTTTGDSDATPTADPSADLDAAEPTSKVKRHAKRGVVRGMAY